MPPKRKIPKTQENTEVVEETSNEAPVSKKKSKPIEEPSASRTLRPRTKTLPAEPNKTETKTKSVKRAKKEASGDLNNKKDPSKKAKKGGKKRNIKQSDDEEPAKKPSELDAIDEVEPEVENATSIYDFTAKDINDQLVSLNKYKGHVCVIVNVASKCGHTSSNYKEFVEIYDKYSEDKGLKILAFPCNQFGKQEPGDNAKICEFAEKRNVKFDMFGKIEVNGSNAHPLWKYLTNAKHGPKGKKIDWNFTKFLINKDGQVLERFKPAVKPSSLVQEFEKLW